MNLRNGKIQRTYGSIGKQVKGTRNCGFIKVGEACIAYGRPIDDRGIPSCMKDLVDCAASGATKCVAITHYAPLLKRISAVQTTAIVLCVGIVPGFGR